MPLLEIKAPGGRMLRQEHASIEAARASLLPGYSVVGTVTLQNADGSGGFVSPVNGPSMMAALLEAHGDELLAWLADKGVDVPARYRK